MIRLRQALESLKLTDVPFHRTTKGYLPQQLNHEPFYIQPPPRINVGHHYSINDSLYNIRRTLSQLCARFISHFFDSHDDNSLPKLCHFIYDVLCNSKLPEIVIFAALIYLLRVRISQRLIRSQWGHGLFLTAYMLAAKFIVDKQYSNRGWVSIGCGRYSVVDLNQMERSMLSYINWDLNVDHQEIEEFRTRFCDSFTGPGPYPHLSYFTPDDAFMDAADEGSCSEPMDPRLSYHHQEYLHHANMSSIADSSSLGSTPASSPFPITPTDDHQPQMNMYQHAPYESFTRNWVRHSQEGFIKSSSSNYLAPPAYWSRGSATAW